MTNKITIIDSNGRRGVGYTTPYHPGIIWARPEGRGQLDGNCMTDTSWSIQPDGSLRGLWYDSPHGAFVSAKIEG
jgi:hypothetical protein